MMNQKAPGQGEGAALISTVKQVIQLYKEYCDTRVGKQMPPALDELAKKAGEAETQGGLAILQNFVDRFFYQFDNILNLEDIPTNDSAVALLFWRIRGAIGNSHADIAALERYLKNPEVLYQHIARDTPNSAEEFRIILSDILNHYSLYGKNPEDTSTLPTGIKILKKALENKNISPEEIKSIVKEYTNPSSPQKRLLAVFRKKYTGDQTLINSLHHILNNAHFSLAEKTAALKEIRSTVNQRQELRMAAQAVFVKNNQGKEAGAEAAVESGKLYILTDSGVIAKPRMANRTPHRNTAQRNPILESTLNDIAKSQGSLLPSFYVDDRQYVLYAKTGVITEYPLRSRELVRAFWHLKNAVTAAHEGKVAHLDINPKNIVLRDNGVPALIDFGCSKSISSKADNTTYAYAPPEYFQAKSNPRAHDIWSLAMSMLQLAAPDSFSEFISKLPDHHPATFGYFFRNYSENKFHELLEPMLAEARLNNKTLTHIIEPLLCFDPGQRISAFNNLEEKFKALGSTAIQKIATVPPLPKQDEASMRQFIKKTNQRILRIKLLQKFCRTNSDWSKRYEYQITVNRDQREQVYLGLTMLTGEKIETADRSQAESLSKWVPTRATRQLNSLVARFQAADAGDEKTRIVFKIIRATDSWLYEHKSSKQRAAVQQLLGNCISYVRDADTTDLKRPLTLGDFSEIIQARSR
jgi:tRNA A-37 threonylcarbamoyl transferase component Bud32